MGRGLRKQLAVLGCVIVVAIVPSTTGASDGGSPRDGGVVPGGIDDGMPIACIDCGPPSTHIPSREELDRVLRLMCEQNGGYTLEERMNGTGPSGCD